MRRLIALLLRPFISIRTGANARHIADLENMLSELISARDTINAEINETTCRLLQAQTVRDAIAKQRGSWIREAAGAKTTQPQPLDLQGHVLPVIPQSRGSYDR